MSIHFDFIGWCKTEGHDKVWTAFKAGDEWYAGWGRRGKKIQFKDHGRGYHNNPPYKLEKLITDKEHKGYHRVDAFQLFAIFPDFEAEVEKYLSFALLANKVK